MSKEIESAVTDIITRANVGFIIGYMREVKNAFGEKGNVMDEWRITFLVAGGIEFQYFTGIGHRVDTALTKLARVQLRNVNRNSIAWHDQVIKGMKPQAPHIASVLHSIIMDSSAVGQSFESWCSDLGYDTDSRKAHATYEACQQNADKLARVFTRAQIDALSEALQDY